MHSMKCKISNKYWRLSFGSFPKALCFPLDASFAIYFIFGQLYLAQILFTSTKPKGRPICEKSKVETRSFSLLKKLCWNYNIAKNNFFELFIINALFGSLNFKKEYTMYTPKNMMYTQKTWIFFNFKLEYFNDDNKKDLEVVN